MKTSIVRSQPKSGGFSLVEIVVAVGIVATVMVALLGMIPTGLNTVNEAAHTMSEIRIAQNIIGEVQLASWEDVEDWEKNSPYYYDREGNLLEDAEQLGKVYTALVEVDEADGIGIGSKPLRYLKQIRVKISNKRSGSIDWSEEAGLKEYRQFSGMSVMTESDIEANGL